MSKEISRRGFLKWLGLTVGGTVATAAGINILDRLSSKSQAIPTPGITPKPADTSTPLPSAQPSPEATATQAPSPTIEPTKAPATATPDIAKPLPEVINNQTVKFVTPSFIDTNKMFEESVQKGDPKVPVPDQIRSNLEIVTRKNGSTEILGVITQNGQGIDMPSLTDGIVTEVEGSLTEAGMSYNTIIITTKAGVDIAYAYPSGTGWNVKLNQPISTGEILFSTTYKADSKGQKAFEKAGAGLKGVAVMVNITKGQLPLGKGVRSILTDGNGNVVTVKSK